MEKSPKISFKFDCEKCDYHCNKQSEMSKHLTTAKHNRLTNTAQIEHKNLPNDLCCKFCERKYKSRVGLWYHNKKCAYKDPPDTLIQPSILDNELVQELLKQNQEFKTMLMELAMKPTTTNNTHTNSHNKQFNLNVFLNETCKDAMNLTDFIDSLKISFTDLEKVGENGFVEGISRIFINGLKELDVNKRPIHCSDVKREVMHLKTEDEWKKECDEQYPLLSKAIHKISHKNIQTLHSWKDKNPECKDSASKKSDVYLKWMQQSLGPCDKEKDKQNYGRIIQRVAKETFIEKG